jgi:hypothetical protein
MSHKVLTEAVREHFVAFFLSAFGFKVVFAEV